MSDSDSRQRPHVVSVRLSPEELASLKLRADRSGLSLSAYFRATALGSKPLRAERQPAVNRQVAARLIGELGRLRQGLVDAAAVDDSGRCREIAQELERDFWELRALCFEAFGREP